MPLPIEMFHRCQKSLQQITNMYCLACHFYLLFAASVNLESRHPPRSHFFAACRVSIQSGPYCLLPGALSDSNTCHGCSVEEKSTESREGDFFPLALSVNFESLN